MNYIKITNKFIKRINLKKNLAIKRNIIMIKEKLKKNIEISLKCYQMMKIIKNRYAIEEYNNYLILILSQKYQKKL